jgi:DNA repair protein RecN (Recombination protein N)
VIVHGQADQLRLKSAVAQREALDQFAGADLSNLLSEYQSSFGSWRDTTSKLESLKTQGEARLAKLAQLREAVADFDQVEPQPGEDVELTELAQRLTHSEELRLAVTAAHEAISSEGFETVDAISQLGLARKSLEQVAVHDEQVAQQAEVLKQIGYQLNDAAAALNCSWSRCNRVARNWQRWCASTAVAMKRPCTIAKPLSHSCFSWTHLRSRLSSLRQRKPSNICRPNSWLAD